MGQPSYFSITKEIKLEAKLDEFRLEDLQVILYDIMQRFIPPDDHFQFKEYIKACDFILMVVEEQVVVDKRKET